MLYPAPLSRGSKVAITAFSSGVPAALHPRLDVVLNDLRIRGFEVLEGKCLRENTKHVSARIEERASELMQFLCDESIDAILAPWGGEMAMDLLPMLDWARLQNVKPKWILGFSDISTILTAVFSKLGWATCHGTNLMQLSLNQTDALTSKVFDFLSLAEGSGFKQVNASFYEAQYADYSKDPKAAFNLTEPVKWKVLNKDIKEEGLVTFSGRLSGGCLDIHMMLYGSEFFNPLARDNEPFILYFENAELSPTQYFRALQGLKLQGAFENASGILIGRNAVLDNDADPVSGTEALTMALGDLPIPVVYDVDIGHLAPNLTLVNGALAEVELTQTQGSITQTLI
ncbi:LD-carboxypeptidase [Pseudoalteromonas luteoviolacea]|uniref:S66 family peptidase n=1 Tax=Pseudoalteromonas luteoviolacea TaxID=43657 RepID=UPI001B35E3B2|nr:S66 peptidase family protein [Pseudoalteromonas luteoviolacea]MBQ4810927.1 LD-carboxypeptidase [Pseudoalteromonas luteoviolacea]